MLDSIWVVQHIPVRHFLPPYKLLIHMLQWKFVLPSTGISLLLESFVKRSGYTENRTSGRIRLFFVFFSGEDKQ